MSRVGFLVCTLLAAILAGCTGSSAGPKEEEQFEEAPEFQEVEVTAETGAIRGIVVDEAIVPISGADVGLSPGGLTTTSGESGAFVFDDLEPGTYFVRVTKLGYFSAQQSVEVVAGVEEPPVVKVLLQADISFAPYTQLQVWEGFLQCGVTVYVAVTGVGFNACGLVDDGFITYFTMDDGIPDKSQAEMIWDSTQTLSPELSLGYYRSGTTNWKNFQGPSPIILPATYDEIVDGRPDGENATDNPMRVFPPYSRPAGFGMTLNQDFTVYMTYFYGFLPREDWAFILDGACDGPEDCGAPE
jgi:hypothetical protein